LVFGIFTGLRHLLLELANDIACRAVLAYQQPALHTICAIGVALRSTATDSSGVLPHKLRKVACLLVELRFRVIVLSLFARPTIDCKDWAGVAFSQVLAIWPALNKD
jgi:hypothetical protein